VRHAPKFEERGEEGGLFAPSCVWPWITHRPKPVAAHMSMLVFAMGLYSEVLHVGTSKRVSLSGTLCVRPPAHLPGDWSGLAPVNLCGWLCFSPILSRHFTDQLHGRSVAALLLESPEVCLHSMIGRLDRLARLIRPLHMKNVGWVRERISCGVVWKEGGKGGSGVE
jgi:hypothetical protein